MKKQSVYVPITGEEGRNHHQSRPKSITMRLFRKLHLWLSLPLGLILSAVCFSGAMLVFENDLTPHLRKSVYYVESFQRKALPMEDVLATVQKSLPDTVSVTGVTVFKDPQRTWQVALSSPAKASLFVDQYSGKITGRYERVGFFKFMFNVHRWLLDDSMGHRTGRLIVGISVLLFIPILITGIVLWIQRARRSFKRSLRIPLKHGLRPFWNGFHVAGGMYVVVFLLAMALTGLTWSFHWYNVGFSALFGAEVQPSLGHGHHSGKHGGKSGKPEDMFVSWQTVFDRLSQEYPDAEKINISNGKADVPVKNSVHSRAADKYKFDEKTGEFTQITKFEDAPKSDKVKATVRAVHLGSWGGIITKILWFLTALLGATLPLTGYYIWYKRLSSKRGSRSKASCGSRGR